jgi:adenylate kinase
MMREPFDIRALAQAIHQRRLELKRARPHLKVPITPAMSRILEADPGYVPRRRRRDGRQRREAVNPSIGTVAEIATALGTTVGALLGERAYRITNADRERVREFVRFLTVLFELDDIPE